MEADFVAMLFFVLRAACLPLCQAEEQEMEKAESKETGERLEKAGRAKE